VWRGGVGGEGAQCEGLGVDGAGAFGGEAFGAAAPLSDFAVSLVEFGLLAQQGAPLVSCCRLSVSLAVLRSAFGPAGRPGAIPAIRRASRVMCHWPDASFHAPAD
jgi:hypothetical protein